MEIFIWEKASIRKVRGFFCYTLVLSGLGLIKNERCDSLSMTVWNAGAIRLMLIISFKASCRDYFAVTLEWFLYDQVEFFGFS